MIKTLRPKKEIEEDISRWQDLPCLWVSRISIVHMAVLAKETYSFRATPINIPTQFFTDLESTVFRSLWKHKRPKLAYAVLNSRPAGLVSSPDVTFYYRPAIMGTTLYWHKAELWIYRMESGTHMRTRILQQLPDLCQRDNLCALEKWYWPNWMATRRTSRSCSFTLRTAEL